MDKNVSQSSKLRRHFQLNEDSNKFESVWDQVTDEKPHSTHYLLIIQKGQQVVLLQSYFGHYTYLQWCNFNQPLAQIPTPPSTDPTWFREIIPHPKNRGILNLDDIKVLAQDLNKLTFPGDNI
jgi:hypothetical protein